MSQSFVKGAPPASLGARLSKRGLPGRERLWLRHHMRGRPSERQGFPSASWLSKIAWSPANALLPWQSQTLSLFRPRVQPAGRAAVTRLGVGCWQQMPCGPQESPMNASHTGAWFSPTQLFRPDT